MSGPRSTDGRGADPLDLFSVLADEAPDLGTDEDLAQVRRAVTAMRRGQRLVDQQSVGRRAAQGSVWLATLDWYRAAAVAVLSIGLLSLAASGWRETLESPLETAALEAAAAETGEADTAARADAEATPADGPDSSFGFGVTGWADVVPAVDGSTFSDRPVAGHLLQPTTASVYELEGEDLDLVMVVDETLDV